MKTRDIINFPVRILDRRGPCALLSLAAFSGRLTLLLACDVPGSRISG